MMNNKDSIPRIIDDLRDMPKAHGIFENFIGLCFQSLADRLERTYYELKKEHDELELKLNGICRTCELCTAIDKRLAAAERCIDEIMNELQKAVAGDSIRNVNKAKKIIRSYREKKGGKK